MLCCFPRRKFKQKVPIIDRNTLTSIADFQELQAHLLTSFKLRVSCPWFWNFPTMHLPRMSFSFCDVSPMMSMLLVVFWVLIMKMLSHPNIVKLIEAIDDPTIDNFYMVLEYVKGKCVCEGACPAGGLGENKARTYLCDTVSSLMYLHSHNIIHGDIKPDNLLVTASGRVKIGDFSVSQAFEGLFINSGFLRLY